MPLALSSCALSQSGEPLNLWPFWNVTPWPEPQSLMVRVWVQTSHHINKLHTFTLPTDTYHNFSHEGFKRKQKKKSFSFLCVRKHNAPWQVSNDWTVLLFTNKMINSVLNVTNSFVSANVMLQRKKKITSHLVWWLETQQMWWLSKHCRSLQLPAAACVGICDSLLAVCLAMVRSWPVADGNW